MVICTCTVRCHGHKEVSARTWRSHRPFRLQIESFEEFLAEYNRARNDTAVVHAPREPSVPSLKKLIFPPRRTRKRRRVVDKVSGAQLDDPVAQASGSGTHAIDRSPERQVR